MSENSLQTDSKSLIGLILRENMSANNTKADSESPMGLVLKTNKRLLKNLKKEWSDNPE